MMGRAELEQEKWECERCGEAYAAQERELRDLAAACDAQWQHKNGQLEIARAVQVACETVSASQASLSSDVESFASKVASALAESSAQQGIVEPFQEAEGSAEGAVNEARRLVEALEAECGSLSASIDDYNARAQDAADSAQECWDTARRLQCEIDNCRE